MVSSTYCRLRLRARPHQRKRHQDTGSILLDLVVQSSLSPDRMRTIQTHEKREGGAGRSRRVSQTLSSLVPFLQLARARTDVFRMSLSPTTRFERIPCRSVVMAEMAIARSKQMGSGFGGGDRRKLILVRARVAHPVG